MNTVLLDKVCKFFGEAHAVDNLSVQVPAGSIYGFLGPNGAGKTTTLRMIMNIIRQDSGRIEIFGDGSGDIDIVLASRRIRVCHIRLVVSGYVVIVAVAPLHSKSVGAI